MATPRMTPNQVVGRNLRRARGLKGWTQEQAAEKLEPYLGERWSRGVFSAAERSVAGKRIKQFTADDLVAIAAAFEFPVSFFLALPASSPVTVAAPGAREGLSAERLADLMGGPEQARAAVSRLIEQHYDEHGIAYTPSGAAEHAAGEEES